MNAIALELPDDLIAVREGIARFVRAEVITRHERHADLLEDQRRCYRPDGRFTPEAWAVVCEVRAAAAEAGYFTMCVPESLGGPGMGYLAYFVAWEEVFRLCGGRYWLGIYAISHWAKGPSLVLEALTPEMRAEALPHLMSGRQSMCFALSEPGAGSDAAMIKTRAERDGDGWRITGDKIWITNSPHADWCLLFAVTDPGRAAARRGGISAFFVSTKTPGFQVERTIKMWGSPASDEALLHFEGMRVEPKNLVGQLDDGYRAAMLGVSIGRLYNAARGVGMSRWGLNLALEHIKTRQSFGKPLSEYQGVTFPLAECATQLHAAHLMALNAAQLLDRGLPAVKEVAMMKTFCVETAKRVLDQVMQAHGAMGFTNEMGLAEAYIYMRKVNVADGSNEIMRHVIAKQLLAGDTAL